MISTPSTHPPLATQSPAIGKEAIVDDWQSLVGLMISATSATWAVSKPPVESS